MSAPRTHDPLYILANLVSKDFKVRYRNMSLGIFWSLVNPLVMMGVLTFVFTVVFPSNRDNFALFTLMGLLPYNYFALAWAAGTNSIVDNAPLIKKVPFERELVPISIVLGNTLHYLIQMAMLLVATAFIIGVDTAWAWLPLVLFLQIVFVCGVSLLTAALDVYYRDVRYLVESANLVLFWIVPIFYGFEQVARMAPNYVWIYELNPLAAVIFVIRRILLDGRIAMATLGKLGVLSFGFLALGWYVFRQMKKDFSDYL